MYDNYVKLFTMPTFHNVEFAELLRDTGIDAASVEDGVILNYTAFQGVSAARLPHWVFLNRDDINSKLHTRQASMREFRDAESAELGIELVGSYPMSYFNAWEFGEDGLANMYARYAYDEYVGPWELIEDYTISDDGNSMVYHLRGDLDVSSADIMRVGA